MRCDIWSPDPPPQLGRQRQTMRCTNLLPGFSFFQKSWERSHFGSLLVPPKKPILDISGSPAAYALPTLSSPGSLLLILSSASGNRSLRAKQSKRAKDTGTLLESHSVINNYHQMVWKSLPGPAHSGFQASVQSHQVPEAEVVSAIWASPLQAPGIIKLRDNNISSSEPFGGVNVILGFPHCIAYLLIPLPSATSFLFLFSIYTQTFPPLKRQ